MTQEHPITPPQTLVNEWWNNAPEDEVLNIVNYIATQAARWGADQQLDAALSWFRLNCYNGLADDLLAAMRPKPPSLKEAALAELDLLKGDANAHGLGFDAPAIRRALEQLDD